jgi:hypothetical protein
LDENEEEDEGTEDEDDENTVATKKVKAAHQKETLRRVEIARVQRSLRKKRTDKSEVKVTKLNASYARMSRAKLGTYTHFPWEQLNCEMVKGQREEVYATVQGIVKKVVISPMAPVSHSC